VSFAVGLRHHRGAALLATYGDGDRGVVKRIEHSEIAFAGHAKEMVDSVHEKLIDEYLSSGSGLRAHTVLLSR